MATASQIIDQNQQYATNWANQVSTFVNNLEILSGAYVDIANPPPSTFVDYNAVLQALDSVFGNAPNKPSVAVPGFAVPIAPNPTLPTVVDIPIPGFNIAPPVITAGQPPVLTFGTVPTPPAITPANIPPDPTIVVPPAPTLAAIVLPQPPSVQIPLFTAIAPVFSTAPPITSFSFNEVPYSSQLLTEFLSQLLADLRGGKYGIDTIDEINAWGRAADRTTGDGQRARDEADRAYVSRGFSLPPGALFKAVDTAIQAAADALNEVSREIAIKRTDQFIQARQFTLGQISQTETALIQNHGQIMQRTLDAARYMVDASVAIYNLRVTEFNLLLEQYKTEAQVFEIRLRAEVERLSIFRAELEAARIAGEIDSLKLDQYTKQLQGLQIVVDLYKARVDAASVISDTQKLFLESYKAQIDAMSAINQAEKIKVDAYEAALGGDETRARIYESQVRGYSAEIDGLKASADVKRTVFDTHAERARVQLALHTADVNVFETKHRTEVQKADLRVRLYSAEGGVYGTRGQVASDIARLGIANYEASRAAYVATLNYEIDRARVALDEVKETIKVRLGAGKIGTEFYSNIVSGALSAASGLASQVSQG